MNSIPISQIRLIMEYKSFPMWLCDKDGIMVSEGVVEELRNDAWLNRELMDVQSIYNGLFIDNEIEFSFRGFSSAEEDASFYARLQTIAQYISKQVGKKYLIRNSFGEGDTWMGSLSPQ